MAVKAKTLRHNRNVIAERLNRTNGYGKRLRLHLWLESLDEQLTGAIDARRDALSAALVHCQRSAVRR